MIDFPFTEHQVLRGWVLITGLAGLSASVGAYRLPLSPHKTLYRLSPHTAHPEFARMYATWLLTSTIVRLAFVLIGEVGSPLFWVTFCTYCVALLHFTLEIFVYKVAALKPAGIAPIVVATGSMLWFGKVALWS